MDKIYGFARTAMFWARKLLPLIALALVAMFVGVYGLASYKQSAGWSIDANQEVMLLVDLMKVFGVLITGLVVILVAIKRLGSIVFKDGTAVAVRVVAGVVLAVITVSVALYTREYWLNADYQAAFILPALFVGLIAGVWLSSRTKTKATSPSAGSGRKTGNASAPRFELGAG